MDGSYNSENIEKLMDRLLHVNEITVNKEIIDMCDKAASYISKMEMYRYEITSFTKDLNWNLDESIR